MTARKKKGLGFIVSGGVFLIAGVICFATQATPVWFPTVISVIGLVANGLGLVTTFPGDV